MQEQIYIPKKLRVGYNDRDDTYSGKLAYVIYFDDKGKLRKETSWKNWIEKDLGVDDFENVPTEGFVLNRNVGGVRESYGNFDTRIEKVRVYDPRGFEIEIDMRNLLFILQECTSTKGKGLEGKFVYGWHGASLVLLPTECPEFKQCQEYTSIQSEGIKTKDLKEGCVYKTKKLKDLIYLGKFDWFEKNYRKGGVWEANSKFIFVDENALENDYMFEPLNRKDYDSVEEYNEAVQEQKEELEQAIENGENIEFIPLGSVSSIAKCVSDVPVSHYAELMTKFNSTENAGIPTELIAKEAKPKLVIKKTTYGWEHNDKNDYYIKNEDGEYINVDISPYESHSAPASKEPKTWEISERRIISFKPKTGFKSQYMDWDKRQFRDKRFTTAQLSKMKFYKLSVRLSSNGIVKAEKYH